MTWLAFRVEVHTSDGRDDAPDRIRREMLRALEHRFGAVTVEPDVPPPDVIAAAKAAYGQPIVVHAGPMIEPVGPWKVDE